MSFRNDFTPIWEAVTTSDTVSQNYYGLANAGTATAIVVYKSEAAGSDITLNLPAGAQWASRVVLVKTTGTSGGTLLGAKAY
jgi:hypothetical protein